MTDQPPAPDTLPEPAETEAAEAAEPDHLLHFLENVGHNLTAQATRGALRPCHGRAAEVDEVLHVLSRAENARPLVWGPPRVGKTAIVREVVRRLAFGPCPDVLTGQAVFELSPLRLVQSLGTDWQSEIQGFVGAVAERGGLLLYLRDLPEPSSGDRSKLEGGTILQLLAQSMKDRNLRCVVESRTNTIRHLLSVAPEAEECFDYMDVAEPIMGSHI